MSINSEVRVGDEVTYTREDGDYSNEPRFCTVLEVDEFGGGFRVWGYWHDGRGEHSWSPTGMYTTNQVEILNSNGVRQKDPRLKGIAKFLEGLDETCA